MASLSTYARFPMPFAAAITATLGCVTLLGWLLDVELMKRGVPGSNPINPTAALCLVALAIALHRREFGRGGRWAAALAATVGSIKLLTLFGLPLPPVDALLFGDAPGLPAIAPATAMCLAGSGIALLLPLERQHLQDALLTLVFGLGLLGVTGYGYGYDASATTGIGAWIMPFPGAVSFAAASLALLLEDRRFGLGRLVFSTRAAGAYLRRWLPALLGLPILMGGLRQHAQQAGIIDDALGAATTSAMCGLALAAIAIFHARRSEVSEINHAKDEARLRESERRFASAVEYAPIGMSIVSLEGRFLYANSALCGILGFTREELSAASFQDLTHPDDLGDDLVMHERLLAGEIAFYHREKRYLSRHGLVCALVAVSVVRDDEGSPLYYVAQIQDVTAQKAAERIERRHAAQQSLIAAFGQAALSDGERGRVLRSAVDMLKRGLDAGEAGYASSSQVEERIGWAADFGDADLAQLRHGNAFWLSTHADTLVAPVMQRGRGKALVARAVGGIAPGDLAYGEAIAKILETALERLDAEARVSYLAQFDQLTKLPNRGVFGDRVEQSLLHAKRDAKRAGVMFVDVDRFKEVNDQHGHAVGDALLQEIARRLRACIRAGDTVARLGGDEFGIVLGTLTRAEDAAVVAQKVVAALAEPVRIDAITAHVSASVGIAIHPDDGGTAEALLTNADSAMYRAKENGRNNYQFFQQEFNERRARRLAVERELRDAIANEEFVVHYQPQVSLSTGQVVGAEALVRWNHPVKGLLSPAEFIPVAEDSGLISALGELVLRRACFDAASWRRRGFEIPVAVNVSPVEVRRGQVDASVRRALADSGLPARSLEIELTETIMMDGAETFIASIAALKALGVRVAIDDFGTGYSSLSYLKRFPIDRVKIDQGFVRDVANEVEDAAIVRAVIAMAHQLRLEVVAEGVETAHQSGFLRRANCDVAQGYLFSPALPSDGIVAYAEAPDRFREIAAEDDRPSLLIVDDEREVRTALVRSLRRDGYRITTAASAAEALEVLGRHRVDVVLTDQQMPDVSGIKLLSKMKSMYPEVQRIVLSGQSDAQTVTEAINDGAIFKFLTKPWDLDQLRDTLRAAFARHAAANDRAA